MLAAAASSDHLLATINNTLTQSGWIPEKLIFFLHIPALFFSSRLKHQGRHGHAGPERVWPNKYPSFERRLRGRQIDIRPFAVRKLRGDRL
jgi:hypothetical protein